VRVRRTEEERAFLYAAFDLGDAAPTAAALDAGIERSSGCGVLRRAFEAGDSVRFVRAFARRWGAGRATLASLAAEDRDAVLSAILDRIDVPAFGGGAIVTAAESAGVDVAPSLRAARAAERLRAIEAGAPDAAGALATSIGGEHWAGDVDLRSAVARGLEQRLAAWISSPDSLPAIEGVAELIEAAARAGVEVSLWRAQNLVIAAIERERSRGTRTTAIDQALRRLADTLGIAPDAGSDEAV